MDARKSKRIVILVAYAALFFVLSGLVYFSVFRVAPSCTDGKQNGNEDGIDCGGSCSLRCEPVIPIQELTVKERAVLYSGPGKYDVMVMLANPNDLLGASAFSYRLEVKAQNGEVLTVREGTNYILPQESKYILEFNLETGNRIPESVSIILSNIEWKKFTGYQEKPRLIVSKERFERVSSGSGYMIASGLVVNDSPFDFRKVLVKVVLRDATSQPLAVHMTDLRSFRSGEQRDFNPIWPSSFPGEPAHIDVEVDADVFRTENFTRQYLPVGER